MDAKRERQGLGQVIRALREMEGLSREELGNRAKLGVDMIAKVEQGAKAPSARALTRLAAALGVDPMDLSYRGLAWASLKESPEASTALLRHIATGSTAGTPLSGAAGAVAIGAGIAALGPMLPAAGAVAAGAASIAYIRNRAELARTEELLRAKLNERLARASSVAELVDLASALDVALPEPAIHDPNE